ncbi:hypothetical protein CYMTET_50164 [Cymbomonas tetramitiformis]|uniref:Uncharacterized protein n=1 Tax=Cymbomonas tetramitiformis TaxID=36881 RepID=A0AAE0BNS3_9CHLO|nr:hypothetical protein CYMTET_50164 [Cymbomonas tetramitiformis]
MEDLITASESSDSERGLTEAEDEAQELVCVLHDLPGPAQDAGAGYVDPATDQPVTAEAAQIAAGGKGKPHQAEDPDPPLNVAAMFSDDDEDYRPVSPPTVVGELTHLNGLWWAETPDLWHDAADTLAKMEAIPTTLGLQTRAQKQRAMGHEDKKKHDPSSPLDESPFSDAESVLEETPVPSIAPQEAHRAPVPQPGDPVVDKHDWKLKQTEFRRLQSTYSKLLGRHFQVDACCDTMGINRQRSSTKSCWRQTPLYEK